MRRLDLHKQVSPIKQRRPETRSCPRKTSIRRRYSILTLKYFFNTNLNATSSWTFPHSMLIIPYMHPWPHVHPASRCPHCPPPRDAPAWPSWPNSSSRIGTSLYLLHHLILPCAMERISYHFVDEGFGKWNLTLVPCQPVHSVCLTCPSSLSRAVCRFPLDLR